MKKRALFWLSFIAMLVLSTAVWAKEPEKVELRLKYQVGQAFAQRVTIDQKITQTISGQNVVVEQTIGMVIGQEVQSLDESGNANIKITYRSFYYKQKSALGTFEYDSTNPPKASDPMSAGFVALAGESFSARCSPRGEILEISGLDQMMQNIVAKLNLPEGPLRDSIRKMCSESSTRESLMQNVALYPVEPVGVGDHWTEQMTTSGIIPLLLENTYTVKKISKDAVFIDVCSNVKTNSDAPPMQMGGMNLKYDIQGTQKGTAQISLASGQIQKADYIQDLSGTVTLGNSPEQSGKSWPIKMISKITMEYIR